MPQVMPPSEPSKSVFSHFTFPSDGVLVSKTSGVSSASTSKKIRTNTFTKNSMTTNAIIHQTPSVLPKSALKDKLGKTQKPKA